MKPNQKDELEKKTDNEFVRKFAEEKYKYGFTTEVHTDIIERGLNEDVIRLISSKKDEPEWLLEFRLKAYRHWLTLEMPTWAHLRIPEIDYQAISYYADPTKKKEGPKSMEEVDPELIKTFNKLGIPLEEQMALSGMAVDAVMDSVSVKTTFKETLMEKGIIFCSFSEAVREHPDLWKYPSCILTGDNSTAEFYSVAVTNNYQQADTGTKMIHLGKNTRSTIVSKGISAGHSENSYRGLVRVAEKADNARNYSQCDSLLLGDKCGAHTFPYMDIHNETAVVEHEATTSKISEDQIFYCNQRGIPTEDAIGLIVNGYAKEVLNKLPMEFAVEAQKLLTISLEGSVG